jgi:hypothetical protein
MGVPERLEEQILVSSKVVGVVTLSDQLYNNMSVGRDEMSDPRLAILLVSVTLL